MQHEFRPTRVLWVAKDTDFELEKHLAKTHQLIRASNGSEAMAKLAQLDHPEEIGWMDVVSVADRALYTAKDRGRDGWVGICDARGEPGDGLARRLREDFSGCISRGEIMCQMSEFQDETEAEKDETSSRASASPED